MPVLPIPLTRALVFESLLASALSGVTPYPTTKNPGELISLPSGAPRSSLPPFTVFSIDFNTVSPVAFP